MKVNNFNIKKTVVVVIAVLVIVLVIGVSFAYFLANVKGEEKKVTASTGTVSLTFNDNNEIIGNNIVSGWIDEKDVTITNTGTADTKYSLYWSCIENELTRTNDLTYEVLDNNYNLIKSGEFPKTAGSSLIDDVKLAKNDIVSYKIRIIYAKTNEDQSVDMGKSFKGVIDVNTPGNPIKTECSN